MGKATQAPPAYRDDPDAVSLHTTPDDYTYNDAPEISGLPPSYTDSETGSSTSITAPPIHHVPPPTTRTNHNSPTFKHGVPVVCETQNIQDAQTDSDPVALEALIRFNADIAPTPYIYIMGTHKETIKRGDKKETQHITDFRIVVNLQRYLHKNFDPSNTESRHLYTVENGVKTHRGSSFKCRAPGSKQDIELGTSAAPTLTEWCHRYCASPRMLRIFRLERTVPGLDKTYLKNCLEGLIASTNYRGTISITFPIEDRNLDIYTTNKINQWRLKTWVCWIFYISFLWIFTWPYLFFMTKRYAVVTAEWPWSLTVDDFKVYRTVSEEQWFAKWNVAVRRLVLDRYQGEASEQMMEGVIARPEDPRMPGTIGTGHEGIDGAVGVLAQGFRVARAIQGGGDVGRGFQGGWGYDT